MTREHSYRPEAKANVPVALLQTNLRLGYFDKADVRSVSMFTQRDLWSEKSESPNT